MSDSISGLVIFFRLINFAIFIGVIWYIYWRYFKRKLEDTIHDKEILAKGTEELSYMLEGRILALDDDLLQQQARADNLKEKVIEWQEKVSRHAMKKQEQQAKLLQTINERIHQKSARLLYKKHTQQIVPEALIQARVILQERFLKQEEQRAFLHDIVRRMRDHEK